MNGMIMIVVPGRFKECFREKKEPVCLWRLEGKRTWLKFSGNLKYFSVLCIQCGSGSVVGVEVGNVSKCQTVLGCLNCGVWTLSGEELKTIKII